MKSVHRGTSPTVRDGSGFETSLAHEPSLTVGLVPPVWQAPTYSGHFKKRN